MKDFTPAGRPLDQRISVSISATSFFESVPNIAERAARVPGRSLLCPGETTRSVGPGSPGREENPATCSPSSMAKTPFGRADAGEKVVREARDEALDVAPVVGVRQAQARRGEDRCDVVGMEAEGDARASGDGRWSATTSPATGTPWMTPCSSDA